ncbi:putative signal peptide protein [Puccinia sorghi]|uniref:Putative signal peptide protein n=1 Tax=Puccinia sorghi TaxID=27349 RepID=A0A0L6V6Y7_9BASI|nr:putative signal peptide protein [Puccinia sorghi]
MFWDKLVLWHLTSARGQHFCWGEAKCDQAICLILSVDILSLRTGFYFCSRAWGFIKGG